MSVCPAAVAAQGVTTGAVTGQVTDSGGRPLENAQVQVLNTATGYRAGALTRENGRYFVQGLEVGSVYQLTVRLIGFAPRTQDNVRVTLGQATRVDFILVPQATTLSAVEVEAQPNPEFSPTRQGAGITIDTTILQRVPIQSRDVTDLTRLAPQVAATSTQGPSAGGAYNRLNTFTVDGVNQSDRFNLGESEGQPGGASGGRILSVEAVKEFQVLLSPSDVRQGNFAGMGVNAVTRNGTNTFTGSAFYAFRSGKLAYDTNFTRFGDPETQQYAFSLGGPIIRDRLHFFVAPEFQRRTFPALGAYVSGGTNTGGNISPDSIARVQQILGQQYDVDAGSSSLFTRENPLTNLFGRLDWQVSDRQRVVLRQLVNRAEQDEFSRNTNTFNPAGTVQNSGFRLGSNAYRRTNENNSTVLQLFSNFANGTANELSFGYNTIEDVREIPVSTPEISVAVVPTGATNQTQASAAITAGSEQFSPGNRLRQRIFEATDNYSMPLGDHTVTVGGRLEYANYFNAFQQRIFGAYKFLTIDSLAAGRPSTSNVGYSNGGQIPVDVSTMQYSAYAQDQWTVRPTFTVNYGLRLEVPQFLDTPDRNPLVEFRTVPNATDPARIDTLGIPGVRTDRKPKTQLLWSPRAGFNWDPSGNQTSQIRGMMGIFTGPAPFILLANAYQNTGRGLVFLDCTPSTANPDAVPAFTTDVTNLPRACDQPGNVPGTPPEPGQAGTTGINLNDPDFKYPQNFTTSLGFDTRAPLGLTLTVEAVFRQAINGIGIRDRNLRGPVLVGGVPFRDVNGRVLYGTTAASNGNVNNSRRYITSLGTPSVSFSEGAIEVFNQSADHNYTLTTQLRRRFGRAFEFTGAYTYTQSEDFQSLTSDRAISNWRNGRQYANPESDVRATTSVFERPHRLVLYGSYTTPFESFPTNISLYYEGISGLPFTYTALGDLNGDGFNNNDPIYVPRNANDPAEMRLGANQTVEGTTSFVLDPTQAAELERFIEGEECLDRQRGRIMQRNSCRSPFQNRMDLSIRQGLPQLVGQRLSLQLDIFNFLNLLNEDWGQIDLPYQSAVFPQQQLLVLRGRTSGPLDQSQGNFELNANHLRSGRLQRFQPDPNQPSNFYQMQLSVRYAF